MSYMQNFITTTTYYVIILYIGVTRTGILNTEILSFIL